MDDIIVCKHVDRHTGRYFVLTPPGRQGIKEIHSVLRGDSLQ